MSDPLEGAGYLLHALGVAGVWNPEEQARDRARAEVLLVEPLGIEPPDHRGHYERPLLQGRRRRKPVVRF
eukprot:761238-Hanusia_phi.AAC.2